MTVEQLLKKWLGKEGGAERANYQMFLTELTQALDLAAPDPKGAGLGDYQFEAPVRSEAALGTKGTGRIDLYKRDCFILEAKQSQVKPGEELPIDPPEPPPLPIYDLFGNPVGFAPGGGKVAPRYDRLMADARIQAERYALALPGDHKAPPFLIVADIGRAFELYFDWSGNGRGYGFFPDQQNYRISLDDLKSGRKLRGVDRTPAEILHAIWTDPQSIDPRVRAAEVTRDIAVRLSRVAEHLEQEQRKARPDRDDAGLALGIEATSLFLMRVLFCMFAEDVELLPKDSFKRFLADAKDRSEHFWRRGLEDLWSKMNDPQEVNRYWSFGDAIIKYFDGNLFAAARVYDLSPEFKNELLVAAGKDWRAVEPAIFGTLLEQVLTSADRSKLGAHYTPRAYVERLVEATITDVLQPEWEQVRESARLSFESGQVETALEAVRDFHGTLTKLAILDPACGTGNFLYVAMEQLLRLESEAIQLVAEFGAKLAPAVHPNQFLGLELNPRAAVIAELVLWIGWLRHRLANQPDSIGEPVLPPLSNINFGTHGGFDSVLVRQATGEPDADNPRRPDWPEADFIVGNPPFIGGKDIRERLGGDYAEALWKANPRVPKSADFVMQWWDRAADILTRPGTRLKRFGLVTTNSITQVFSRRVIERHLSPSPLVGEGGAALAAEGEGPAASAAEMPPTGTPRQGARKKSPSAADAAGPSPDPASPGHPLPQGERGLSLVLAIPDHPWTRATPDAAAVRIAMTVAEAGAKEGRLVEIVGEAKLDSDEPELEVRATTGPINADLTIGTDVTKVVPLKANDGLCSPGVKLHGNGFIVTPAKARELGLGTVEGLDKHIREYRNGRDLLQRPRGVMVIDLFGLTEDEVMDRFPAVYQHLLTRVRDRNFNEETKKWDGREEVVRKAREKGEPSADALTYLKCWWLHGKPRQELRPALKGLSRYIATTETSKHRIFQFVDSEVLADNMIVVLASDDAFHLGILQSSIHQQWALNLGGWLGFGNDNRYNKSKVFDPFPFPDPSEQQRAEIARLGERLDETRRAALADNDRLTMTGLYNLVEAVRSGTLPPERDGEATRARARIVAKLHDDLDQAVADAYGWGEEWRRAPLSTGLRTGLPPSEIVARLVALNAERAKEEAQGIIRWLRPDYQKPRFGKRKKADPALRHRTAQESRPG